MVRQGKAVEPIWQVNQSKKKAFIELVYKLKVTNRRNKVNGTTITVLFITDTDRIAN
jgi:hypothetical protein